MPEGEYVSIRKVNEGHSHTKTDPEDKSKIAVERDGSNCGIVSILDMVDVHEQAGKEWHVVSEHDFDPARDKPNPGFVSWLEGEYLKDPDLVTKLAAEGKTPHDYAEEQVKATLNYGPERLIKSFRAIGELKTGMKVFKGIEASIIGPNGELGTEMIEGLEVLNVSIHPNALPEKYRDVAKDPKKYTDWVVAAMEHNSRMNVICHIGWDCPDLDIKALDWARIAKTAREHGTGMEIANLYEFLKDKVYGKGGILDHEAYPENNTSWRKDFAQKLRDYLPAVFDPEIRKALAPEIAKGLKFSVTADQHRLPPKAGEGWANPQETAFRFVYALKLIERELNAAMAEMEVKPEQVVNTLSVENYIKFLKKEGITSPPNPTLSAR